VAGVLLCLTPFVGACSTSPSKGTLRGQSVQVGNLASETPYPVEAAVWIWKGTLTSAQAMRQSPVARLFSDREGQYSVSLKPGDYSVWVSRSLSKLIEPTYCGSRKRVGLGVPVHVVVRAGHTASADVECAFM